jgi:anti-sigma regulatory factor (Ser/Thr protein kinase)
MSDIEGAQNERPWYASVTAPSRVESVRLVSQFVLQAARLLQVPPAGDPLFEVAIVEALTNAVRHGNPGRDEATIICELELVNRRFSVRIFDQGVGFAIPRVPTPEWSPTDIERLPESGFGISIIQGVFPQVRTIVRPGEFGLEMALTF